MASAVSCASFVSSSIRILTYPNSDGVGSVVSSVVGGVTSAVGGLGGALTASQTSSVLDFANMNQCNSMF